MNQGLLWHEENVGGTLCTFNPILHSTQPLGSHLGDCQPYLLHCFALKYHEYAQAPVKRPSICHYLPARPPGRMAIAGWQLPVADWQHSASYTTCPPGSCSASTCSLFKAAQAPGGRLERTFGTSSPWTAPARPQRLPFMRSTRKTLARLISLLLPRRRRIHDSSPPVIDEGRPPSHDPGQSNSDHPNSDHLKSLPTWVS